MYGILRTSVNTCSHVCQHNNASPCTDLDPANPWLFTDPAAKVAYAYQERLHVLKEDIRTYVMHDGRWSPEELELKRQIQGMSHSGILIPKGAFGYLSPHPTVYRASGDCVLNVAGRRVRIMSGDDVVFVSWVERLTHPGYAGLVWIGHCYYTIELRLCCEAFPAINKLCKVDLEALHRTFYSSSSH